MIVSDGAFLGSLAHNFFVWTKKIQYNQYP
jgi:hypothetical protein